MLGERVGGCRGRGKRALTLRNFIFSSPSHTTFTFSLLICVGIILINISIILLIRKGKFKLLLTPPCSRYSNHSNLQERSCSTQCLSSYNLCPECSPVSLQCYLLLLQVSPQIVATLTISRVAYTNYSIHLFLHRTQNDLYLSSCVEGQKYSDLSLLYPTSILQHRG